MKKILSLILSFLMINSIFLYAPVNAGAVSVELLTFEMNEDGNAYSITDCETSATGELSIPEAYNGLPVTAIGSFAFEDCKNITSVEFPDSVVSIGEGAFSNSTGLTSVEFPENYQSQGVDTIIVNDCQKLSQWNSYSSSNCEADTESFILGTQSIHSTNGEMVCLKDEYDMVNNNLVLKLRINSISQGSRLYLQVLNTSDWSNRVNYELMRGASTTPVGEWREITVPYTGYTWKSDKPFDFTNVNFIRIYAQGEVDWNLQYTAQRPIEEDKGIITFTFDDGYTSQYTGIEILAERGIPGTIFYIPEANTNGSDEFLKVPHLQELVNKYSTDIEVHGISSYNDMTNEELINHWEYTQKLFRENGLGEGRHMAYPNGMHEERVVQLARRYFDSCRTIQYYIPSETLPTGDMYRIRAISSIGSSGNNVDFVKERIDRAVLSKSWLILVFHKIGDVTGDSMYCSGADLGEIADYAKNSGADIMTMAQAVSKMTPRGITIGKNAFASCVNLKSISVPSDVRSIGENAFGFYDNDGNPEKIEDFTIKGVRNSSVDFYAQDNDFSFEEICEHPLVRWIKGKSSTCVEKGAKYKDCALCEKRLLTDEIDLTDHTEKKDEGVNPTCIRTGKTEGSHCSVCNMVLVPQEVIPATGHTIVKDKALAPTCTKEGKTEGSHCSVCNITIKSQVVISPRGHNYSGVWILDSVPDCTGEGSKSRHCSDCNSRRDVTVIKPTGHSGGEWIIDKAPSYSKPGLRHKECEICDESFGFEEISALKLKSPVLKKPVSTKGGVSLKWNKVTGSNGYVVYRKKGNGKFIKLAKVKGEKKLSYVDKSAKKGTKYTYKLKAYSGKIYSAYSNAKTIKDKY